MRKDKLDILVEKARKLFKNLETSTGVENPKGRKAILTGEGLTRKELRILERKGLVRKMTVYQEKRYRDSPATMGYIWEWIGE